MRALVISDIHANLPAFEAVLAAAPQFDVVWNLGDVVGYGANPNEVIELTKKLSGIVVRGNHDRACCGNLRFGEYFDFSTAARCAVREESFCFRRVEPIVFDHACRSCGGRAGCVGRLTPKWRSARRPDVQTPVARVKCGWRFAVRQSRTLRRKGSLASGWRWRGENGPNHSPLVPRWSQDFGEKCKLLILLASPTGFEPVLSP